MRIISLLFLILFNSQAMAAETKEIVPMPEHVLKSVAQGEVVIVDPQAAARVCDFHQQIVAASWDTKLNQFPSFQDTKNVVTAYMCVAK